MGKKLTLPIETLHELLRCDPIAGLLFWRERAESYFSSGGYRKAWNTKYAGNEAFTYKDVYGYKTGAINNKLYRAHRVIWAMETGDWPKDQIDHIDHNRSNNAVVNLRQATNTENSRNASIGRNNTSGVCGVFYDKSIEKWRSEIGVDGKNIRLGLFKDMGRATEVRLIAEEKYGYHQNHGK